MIHRIVGAVGVALFASTGALASSIVIDPFTTSLPAPDRAPLTVPEGEAVEFASDSNAMNGTVFSEGFRQLFVFGAEGDSTAIFGERAEWNFSLTNDDAAAGISYRFLGGFDASRIATIDLDVLDVTTTGPGDPTIDFRLRLESASGAEERVTNTLEDGETAVSFALAGFSAVDLAALQRFEIVVQVTQNFGANVDVTLGPVIATPIPVPAALPLLIGGLGALGLVARRRRR